MVREMAFALYCCLSPIGRNGDGIFHDVRRHRCKYAVRLGANHPFNVSQRSSEAKMTSSSPCNVEGEFQSHVHSLHIPVPHKANSSAAFRTLILWPSEQQLGRRTTMPSGVDLLGQNNSCEYNWCVIWWCIWKFYFFCWRRRVVSPDDQYFVLTEVLARHRRPRQCIALHRCFI